MSARRARFHPVECCQVEAFGVTAYARVSHPATASTDDVLDAIDSLVVALMDLRDDLEAAAPPELPEDEEIDYLPHLTTDLPLYFPEEEP